VSGFVARMLVDPDVGLFRADERVFTAWLVYTNALTAAHPNSS
jgi:hypothetical protein